MKTLNQFKKFRKSSVPIIALKTQDQQLIVDDLVEYANNEVPVITWDVTRSIRALNDLAKPVVDSITMSKGSSAVNSCATFLAMLGVADPTVTAGSIILMYHAHRLYGAQQEAAAFPIINGIDNLRDIFKANGATLILMSPQVKLPFELKNTIKVLEEPMPSLDEIKQIVETTLKAACEASGVDRAKIKINMVKATDVLTGINGFSVEQTFATSLDVAEGGVKLNMAELWEQKCRTIEQTKGLKIWRGGESLDDIYGYDSFKELIKDIFNGKRPPKLIVFIDEGEKAIGPGGDSNGIDDDFMGVMLQFMQDTGSSGIILVGVNGCAKSAMAKGAGNYGEVPTIQFDKNAMKGGIVSESETAFRDSFDVIKATSQGDVLFLMTCNDVSKLKPELIRRFTWGTYYFGLPTEEEREGIWKKKVKKFGLAEGQCDQVDDTDWTGAEIEKCCDMADRLRKKISEAAKRIIPTAKARPEMIQRLQEQAEGKFIDASTGEVYKKVNSTATKKARKFPTSFTK